jgi:hypothetical protein
MSLLTMPSDKSGSTPAQVCAEIAQVFRMRATEVGLLQLNNGILTFLFPAELRAAGAIPISSSAIAARTAVSRRAEIFNDFAKIKHHTVFERIKIGDEANYNSQPIQKLMSSPIIGADGIVLGVLQISRRGLTPAAAGPNFEAQDLKKLELVANELAELMPQMTNSNISKRRLTFLTV